MAPKIRKLSKKEMAALSKLSKDIRKALGAAEPYKIGGNFPFMQPPTTTSSNASTTVTWAATKKAVLYGRSKDCKKHGAKNCECLFTNDADGRRSRKNLAWALHQMGKKRFKVTFEQVEA